MTKKHPLEVFYEKRVLAKMPPPPLAKYSPEKLPRRKLPPEKLSPSPLDIAHHKIASQENYPSENCPHEIFCESFLISNFYFLWKFSSIFIQFMVYILSNDFFILYFTIIFFLSVYF